MIPDISSSCSILVLDRGPRTVFTSTIKGQTLIPLVDGASPRRSWLMLLHHVAG